MQVCPQAGMQSSDQTEVHHHPKARDLHRARAEVPLRSERCLRGCPQAVLLYGPGPGGIKGRHF